MNKISIHNNPEKLAYLIGALRDGCFIRNDSNHIYRIKIYQKNKEWIEILDSIIQELFGKKSTISLDVRDSVWNLMVNSKIVYQKLVEYSDFPGSQKVWNTPKFVLNSDLEVQKSYVRGFFDSEGGVPHIEERKIKPKDIRVEFTQVNKKCLEEGSRYHSGRREGGSNSRL